MNDSRPRRPRALTVVLVVLALGNLGGLMVGLLSPERLTAPHPRLAAVWPVYLATPLLALIGLAGMWRMRRWGGWVVAVATLLVLGIEAWAVGPGLRLARVPLSALLLFAATRPVWRAFR